MSKINELMTTRAKAWEDAKAFLDSHRNDSPTLSSVSLFILLFPLGRRGVILGLRITFVKEQQKLLIKR